MFTTVIFTAGMIGLSIAFLITVDEVINEIKQLKGGKK